MTKGKEIKNLDKWIDKPFTKAEKQERIAFYAKSGIIIDFSNKLVELE